MLRISVDFDMSEVVRWSDDLANTKMPQVKARIVNRAAEQGQTEMIRQITRTYAVSAKLVRDRLKVRRASASAGKFLVEAYLVGTDPKRSMNLIHFVEKAVTLAQAAKRTKAGEGGTQQLRNGAVVKKALELRFKIKRVGEKKLVDGAFIGNKGRTVFKRTGDKRLPIEAIQTINVPQMFNTKVVNAAVVRKIREVLPVIARRELKWALGQ